MTNYQRNATCLIDRDLTEFATICIFDASELSGADLKKLEDDGLYLSDESDTVCLQYYDYDQLENPPYNSTSFEEDEELAKDLWDGILKPADHYLIYASHCKWNGASGYKIVDDQKDLLYRNYDISFYLKFVSKGGKILIAKECSHDVPLGALTYIIALTEREYRTINQGGLSIKKFVEDQTKLTPYPL